MTARLRGHRAARCCAPRNKARGFTLLEALIAIAIAAIALGVLARAVGQAAQTALGVAQRQQAAIVARSVLASGTFAEDFALVPEGHSAPWSWRIRLEPQAVVLSDTQLRTPDQAITAARLTIEVFGHDSAEPAFVLTAWKPYRSAP